jgi:hypothetical protein
MKTFLVSISLAAATSLLASGVTTNWCFVCSIRSCTNCPPTAYILEGYLKSNNVPVLDENSNKVWVMKTNVVNH